MQISVTQIGTPPIQFLKKVEAQFISLKDGIAKLGSDTREQMRTIIQTTKHRGQGTGNLERTINSYVSSDGWSVGIGLVSELNVNAPYWYIVNYGGWAAPVGTEIWGHFGQQSQPNANLAGTGVGREPFTMGSFPLYKMTIKHPIYAMNYIERTTSWLATVWRVHLNGALNRRRIN